VPVVVGASRKSVLGRITGTDDPSDRAEASLAAATWAMANGAAMVRAHDVRATVQATRLVGGAVGGVAA
jgi:dihydropteroate synthase